MQNNQTDDSDTAPIPGLDAEYLAIVAQAIIDWVRSELLKETDAEGNYDGESIYGGLDFILMMIKRVPAIGGLCLQAGANKHIPYIPMKGWESNAGETEEVQESGV